MKFIAQSSGSPSSLPLLDDNGYGIVRFDPPKLLIRARLLLFGTIGSKGIVARLSTSERKYWAQIDTNNLLLNCSQMLSPEKISLILTFGINENIVIGNSVFKIIVNYLISVIILSSDLERGY